MREAGEMAQWVKHLLPLPRESEFKSSEPMWEVEGDRQGLEANYIVYSATNSEALSQSVG